MCVSVRGSHWASGGLGGALCGLCGGRPLSRHLSPYRFCGRHTSCPGGGREGGAQRRVGDQMKGRVLRVLFEVPGSWRP